MAKAKVAKNRGQKYRHHGTPRAIPRRAVLSNGERAGSAFLENKSIEQLAAEQGVKLQGQLERIMGAGADLWASDAEFEEFVQGIYQRRKEGLIPRKP